MRVARREACSEQRDHPARRSTRSAASCSSVWQLAAQARPCRCGQHGLRRPRPRAPAKLPGTRSSVAGAVTMEKPTSYKRRHHLQQLLRVRHRQVRPGAQRRHAEDRGRGRWPSRARSRSRGTCDLDALLKLAPMEERIYRLRCVEGWSMVIPWVGYSLSELIKRVEPTGNAKFVQFVTLADQGADAGPALAACSTGPTSKACASTRRCTR